MKIDKKVLIISGVIWMVCGFLGNLNPLVTAGLALIGIGNAVYGEK